jgi:hypothetical protein
MSMGTAGARHLADSEKWMAWERELSTTAATPGKPVLCGTIVRRTEPRAESKVHLYEAAAAHDGQPAEAWRRAFLSLWQ